MGQPCIAKLQHYVPRFLLRNFGTGKKDQLYVFDKLSGKCFKAAAHKVAAENQFYDFDYKEYTLTLEPSLAQLESQAAKIIRKLLNASNMKALSPEDRATLARFFSVQMVRTKASRERWRHMGKLLADGIRRIAPDNSQELIEKYVGPESNRNEEAFRAVHFIQSAPENFALHFLEKTWLLLKTNKKHPFCIGDHPLGMQNTIQKEFQGNIGLAVEGIEIYFPLDPENALAMWCPSHEANIRQGLASGVKSSLERIVFAIDTGCPLQYVPENVINFNSLQIIYAERYVFSFLDDFVLARNMLRTNPGLRTGPRYTAG